jgi:peptide chain release factor 3
LDDPLLDELLEKDASNLRNDVDLINGVYSDFDVDDYLSGNLAPVFFGSALNNFGVKELLEKFLEIAPFPQPRQSSDRVVAPEETKFTGFIFKIHANLDPRHRDRIAFLRVCSGKFERNKFFHHVRLNKNMKIC